MATVKEVYELLKKKQAAGEILRLECLQSL